MRNSGLSPCLSEASRRSPQCARDEFLPVIGRSSRGPVRPLKKREA